MANEPLEPPKRRNTSSGEPRSEKSRTQKSLALKKSDIFTVGSVDVPFFAITFALLTIGLVMLYSASYPYALQIKGDSYFYFKRQFAFAILGVLVMMFVSKLNYRLLKAVARPLLIVTIGLLGLVLVWHTPVQDFKRWIPLGPITFQPSDVAKFTIILVLSIFVSKNYKRMSQPKYGIVIPLVIIFAFCGLIYLEHHLSCTFLVFCIGASIMYAGGTNKMLFYIGAGVLVALVFLVIVKPEILMNYAGTRVEAWLDKSFDPLGDRWQTNNSLYAIGSGGFLGVGLGNSKQKFLYVSEPQNDFIFSIVCEELGFLGATIIIVLFALLFIRGIHIAMKCQDRFGALMIIGIVTQVAVQTIFNILVVTDTIPNTGISLPFFSYGGTALLMLMFEMGVVLSISRKSSQKKV